MNIPSITLKDALSIPVMGYGTVFLKGREAVDSFRHAIDNGYRMLDSAYNYENEGTLGEAIRQATVGRDELIVTSKLPGRYHEYSEALKAIEESLYRARLDHFDLYLIHWPNPKEGKYVEAWQALIEAKKRGLVRSIGVSNFLPEHIERLEKETGELPVINQIELHPFFNQEEQRKWHDERGIVTESWSPLFRGRGVLSEPVIMDLADKYGKTPAQIVLRWHYQHGAVSIPRSAHPDRQRENLAIFDYKLSEKDMEKIDSLSRPDGRIDDQDPAVYQEF
ncbi:Aldo/keto reductase [Bhargavaea ginsengi]|uniref:Aldo/keto reductase n=1 Tax=Bhargavaea ginsengi TaxID=426757 RepID=A0A1H7C0E3_9BACL|nr:aldo/keto reductase [Bhargavaea ginsengi]SEJ83289.1 Aldo/keto reductase [Bhargavaea ginsengi]